MRLEVCAVRRQAAKASAGGRRPAGPSAGTQSSLVTAFHLLHTASLGRWSGGSRHLRGRVGGLCTAGRSRTALLPLCNLDQC